jgi:hypothetical protein
MFLRFHNTDNLRGGGGGGGGGGRAGGGGGAITLANRAGRAAFARRLVVPTRRLPRAAGRRGRR